MIAKEGVIKSEGHCTYAYSENNTNCHKFYLVFYFIASSYSFEKL